MKISVSKTLPLDVISRLHSFHGSDVSTASLPDASWLWPPSLHSLIPPSVCELSLSALSLQLSWAQLSASVIGSHSPCFCTCYWAKLFFEPAPSSSPAPWWKDKRWNVLIRGGGGRLGTRVSSFWRSAVGRCHFQSTFPKQQQIQPQWRRTEYHWWWQEIRAQFQTALSLILIQSADVWVSSRRIFQGFILLDFWPINYFDCTQ